MAVYKKERRLQFRKGGEKKKKEIDNPLERRKKAYVEQRPTQKSENQYGFGRAEHRSRKKKKTGRGIDSFTKGGGDPGWKQIEGG